MPTTFSPLLLTTGIIKLGATPVDYSAEVSHCEIRRTRNMVELPATFATGTTEQRAGSQRNEFVINSINDLQTTSLWALFWAQIDDPDGEVPFDVLLGPGLVSATNPRFTGTLIVSGVSIGGESGTASLNQLVCPIKGVITKAIT